MNLKVLSNHKNELQCFSFPNKEKTKNVKQKKHVKQVKQSQNLPVTLNAFTSTLVAQKPNLKV